VCCSHLASNAALYAEMFSFVARRQLRNKIRMASLQELNVDIHIEMPALETYNTDSKSPMHICFKTKRNQENL
jgi:hypothetical protein